MAESANTHEFKFRGSATGSTISTPHDMGEFDSEGPPANKRKNVFSQAILSKINDRYGETKYRAAGRRGAATDTENLGHMNTETYGKIPDARSAGPAKALTVPTAAQSDLSLMNLTSTFGLLDAKELHEQVYDTISSVEECDLTELSYAVLGCKYSRNRHVEFLVACFAVDGELKIDIKRLYGDGLLISEFYEEIKSKLAERDVVHADEEDSEIEFEYSEDESGDDGDEKENLHLGYLQLSYDPEIVGAWMKKIEERHDEDQLHIGGLMAHNASNEQNLNIIVNKGGTKLRELITNKLENSNIAALVRFTAVLAKHVTRHPACKKQGYDKEHFLLSILDAMKYWCPGKDGSSKNRQQSTKFEILESRETMKNLVQTIHNLGETMKIIPKATLVKVARDRLEKKKNNKDSPKDTIMRFLEKQEQTKAVMYFRDILAQISE